ncbi:DNA-binding transcriptional regulator, LysR family [Variovorax sp. HW608]|uniref:LysR family transcriptional regulator n=1 Tax=Variovorax sp. HW608 TaxID=1034889 RepID=UPI00081FF753|nr:LysR family transcriptional regulator [Variovorax sp. HW608]SCK22515.1 DNA-binding transcriptional regulator, LysR family [Variovorax sp. HW608]
MDHDDDTEGSTDLLSIKLLRLFDLLYSTNSVTRTAEQMGQGQPTVSNWLRRLREQLGDELFVRTADGMRPTPRADELIVPAREALASLQRLAAPALEFDPSSATRRFRICMTDASHVTLLPQLLAHVRALAPHVSLEAARIDEQTAQALQSGQADLAIGLVPWLESGFYQQVLYPQDWVCLVNASHPRVGRNFGLRDYKAEAHVAIAGGTGVQLLEAALQRHRVERRILLEMPGFLGLAAIVSSTDLIATVPRHIGETLARSRELKVFDCPVPIPPFTVKQHWHARYHQDPANRWLRGVCEGLFAKKSPRSTTGKSRGS